MSKNLSSQERNLDRIWMLVHSPSLLPPYWTWRNSKMRSNWFPLNLVELRQLSNWFSLDPKPPSHLFRTSSHAVYLYKTNKQTKNTVLRKAPLLDTHQELFFLPLPMFFPMNTLVTSPSCLWFHSLTLWDNELIFKGIVSKRASYMCYLMHERNNIINTKGKRANSILEIENFDSPRIEFSSRPPIYFIH